VSAAGGQPELAGAWSATVDRQLSQHEAEVSRLRKAVAMEESDNRKAGERLDQQDRTIAKLQRQLRAIRTTGPASGGP
jgi:septal ring factor EnvC (AmiA/AmiB activator)